MLNHFVQPASLTVGPALDGLQPVREYLPQQQMTPLVPAFELPDHGGEAEGQQTEGQHGTLQKGEGERRNDLFRLIVDPGFQEMIRLFLIPDHDQILSIRSRLRQERGVSELSLSKITALTAESVQKRREKLYEIQVQLFRTPKGYHYQIVI